MDIYKKIPAIMADIDAIGKNRKNQQQGYVFRGIDDVYNALHSVLAKHEVFTTTEVLDDRTEERTTKNGSALIYRILKIRFTFFAADGSHVESIVIGEGMDSGDKASNKAMAVAHKYALLQTFAIPTEDDKDPENASHELAPRKEPQEEPKKVDPIRQGLYADIGKEINGGNFSDQEKEFYRKEIKETKTEDLLSILDEIKKLAASRAEGTAAPTEEVKF